MHNKRWAPLSCNAGSLTASTAATRLQLLPPRRCCCWRTATPPFPSSQKVNSRGLQLLPDTGRVVGASSCVLCAQVTLERLRRMLHLVLGAALEAQFHAGCLSHLVSQQQQGRCTKETSRGCLATLRLFLDTKVLRPAQKIGEKASCKEIRVCQCRNKDMFSRAETC